MSEAEEYVAIASGRVGTRPQLTLLFRKASGEVFGYPYASFSRISALDPAREFVVEFGLTKVIVNGTNLAQMFLYVCQHKAVEIVEFDRAGQFLAEPDAAVVAMISISK